MAITFPQDPRAAIVEITLSQADHLPDSERLALLQQFRSDLEIILGGPQGLQQILQDEHARSTVTDRAPAAHVEPQGMLRKAFIIADYTTWMGRNRPIGARFGLRFARAAAR